MEENIGLHGIISVYEYPARWTDDEFRYWCCPTTDSTGHIIQPARMSDEWRRQRLVAAPFHNLITNTGIALLLTNMSVAGQGSMNPFFQILSAGNGALSGVTRTDTSVVGDGFATGARKAPTSFSTTGFSTTVVTNFASADANGTWTNIGIYGWNSSSHQAATTTTGTGALMTHAPFSYVKGAIAIAVDYLLTLSN